MAVHLCEALEDGGVVPLEQREPLDPARQAAAPSTARRALPRFSDEAIEANRRIVDALRVIAERQGTTPAQLALSWVIRAGTTSIPGTTKPSRMQENAAAATSSSRTTISRGSTTHLRTERRPEPAARKTAWPATAAEPSSRLLR